MWSICSDDYASDGSRDSDAFSAEKVYQAIYSRAKINPKIVLERF